MLGRILLLFNETGGLSVAGMALHSYQYQIKYWMWVAFYSLLPDTLHWDLQRILGSVRTFVLCFSEEN